MKHKKQKILAAVLCIALMVLLGACGGGSSDKTEAAASGDVQTEAALDASAENAAAADQLPADSSADNSSDEAAGADSANDPAKTAENPAAESTDTGANTSADAGTDSADAPAPVLLYLGHASLRIVTPEDTVIYIDPFAGDQYDLAADLILVTHAHYDHNDLDKVANRNDGCRIITWEDALTDGTYQTFTVAGTTIEAVEAGYNENHNVNECVGYILTFSNGKTVYISGDTSTTEQMPLLKDRHLDYAFFCCDGVYNMDAVEAAECAAMVGAAHNIPYHMVPAEAGLFDRVAAEQFDAENRLILEPGQELTIE